MNEMLKQALRRPRLRLHGPVDHDWIDRFAEVADALPEQDVLAVEVMTEGGDAEVGRRLALEAGLQRARGRRLAFLGKTVVYSAGVTFMAGFRPEERWLTPDCRLLIHGRQLTKQIALDGPLGACRRQLEKALSEIETGFELEREGFQMLAEGSRLSVEAIAREARDNWYLSAPEALGHGLIAGVFEG